MSLIRKALDERFEHRRSLPEGQLVLLPPDSATRPLTDLRNKYTRTVFFDPFEEEYNQHHAPRPPKWKEYLKELTPGRARGFTIKMKRELAFKAKYVNQSRLMLRIILKWRAYVDQFTYTRDMLVRVHRLKFVQKCFVAWWLAIKRETKLKIIIRAAELKLLFRRFRLWALMSKVYMFTRRIARLCFSSWVFYLQYKKRLYQDFADLVIKSRWIRASIIIQKWYRRYKCRKEWRARRKIFKGLFWGTKLWRRVYRARLAVEMRRLEREDRILQLVASRTIMALKDYLMTPDGHEDFQRFREKLEKHYREYDLDFEFDEKRNVWVDVKKPHEVRIDKMSFLPPVLKSAAKDLVRNAGDFVNAVAPPLFDKVKAYRIIEDRCVRDVKKQARIYYRRKYPPPYYCTRCNKSFMLKVQMDSHEKHSAVVDCTPKELKSSGYAWYMASDFAKRLEETVMRVFYADVLNKEKAER